MRASLTVGPRLLFEHAFLAPELGFNSRLSVEKQLRLLAVSAVISFAIRRVERRNMNSHVFIGGAVAIKSEGTAVQIAPAEERNNRK